MAKRSGRPICMMMVDVDYFKRVNDTYGHAEGDRVLQLIAAAISSTLRVSDYVCRYGGEEFAVLLPQTDLEPGGGAGRADRRRVAARASPAGWRGAGSDDDHGHDRRGGVPARCRRWRGTGADRRPAALRGQGGRPQSRRGCGPPAARIALARGSDSCESLSTRCTAGRPAAVDNRLRRPAAARAGSPVNRVFRRPARCAAPSPNGSAIAARAAANCRSAGGRPLSPARPFAVRCTAKGRDSCTAGPNAGIFGHLQPCGRVRRGHT